MYIILFKEIRVVTFHKNKYWHLRGFYAFKFSSRETIVTCEIFKTEMISSPGKFPIILSVHSRCSSHTALTVHVYSLIHARRITPTI